MGGETTTPEGVTESLEGNSNPADGAPAACFPPELVAGRYQVRETLGRGGFAVVYRVADTLTGRRLALKQLVTPPSHPRFSAQASAFEREYHALVQLSHPRIIEVYDFGNDERGRFYTMQLLDGGDLRDLSPLPWQTACALFYEVCSSLALLHSRRLVHRDVSPRNVRCTRDGSAKLIDFGTLSPFGAGTHVVGTPPFVAPEVCHRSALDARTDLFSLGATLYFALTGRFAYPARDFASLREAWRQRPPPPSTIASDVPPALDALVQSLLALDPALRPRSAFEVMQRLAGIATLTRDEIADVPRAYTTTPALVGRDRELVALRQKLQQVLAGAGGSTLLHGGRGAGRSRMLDAFALDAKLAGAIVLRVNPAGAQARPLAAAQQLAAQAIEELPVEQRPVLGDLAQEGEQSVALQSALVACLIELAQTHPLVMLVDDVESVDHASLAVFASLAASAPSKKLLLVGASESTPSELSGPAAVLQDWQPIALPALDREHTETLLVSLFGDVPNLALLAERAFSAAGGNPRETMELMEGLIARGLVHYEGGQWVLPPQLALAQLASSAAENCRQQLSALSPLARTLAELVALSSQHSLTRLDLSAATSAVPALELDRALSELLARRVLAGDDDVYALSRVEWSEVLLAPLSDGARAAHHRALADVCAAKEGFVVERAEHLLLGGIDSAALDLVCDVLSKTAVHTHGLMNATRMAPERLGKFLERAIEVAERTQRKPIEINQIRHALVAASVASDEGHYYRVAASWLAQLRHDSGLSLYEAGVSEVAPIERARAAIAAASARFEGLPAHERVYAPATAIRYLVYFVAVSIAIGSRAQDTALLASLPSLLEPFAPLSPQVHAVWQNALATHDSVNAHRLEHAHRRWRSVLSALSNVTVEQMSFVASLRAAVRYGVGLIEARMGLASVEDWARSLEDDPFQRVSAITLRRIARLHQGDFAGAERARKQAEIEGLRANVRPMFTSTLSAELVAHALAGDLAGIRATAAAIERLAARFPGWLPYEHLASGYFEQARGQFGEARAAFERGLSIYEPGWERGEQPTGAWLRLEAAYVETLVELELPKRARERGARALERCLSCGLGVSSFVVARALALAEAKLGDYLGASARLERVMRELEALGSHGLELGATYEARARLALWFRDRPAAERYCVKTASEYRYGEGSSLGARYERLLDEAERCGLVLKTNQVPSIA